MRIHDAYGKNIQNVGTAATAQPKKAQRSGSDAPAATSGTQSGSTEKVTVSAKARELAEKATAHEARISELRDQVSNGTLKIDASKIAAKLVPGDDG